MKKASRSVNHVLIKLSLVYAIACAVNFVWEMLQMPIYEGMRFDCLRSCLI